MDAWIPLDSPHAIDAFLEACGGFHDACFREALVTGETYVNDRGGMHCAAHLEVAARMVFQSQWAEFCAFEIMCTGVSLLRLSPTPDNCDSILTDGVVTQLDGSVRLGLSFIGGPLIGPPNSWGEITSNDAHDAPDIEVVAQSMAWRRLARSAGPGRHYQPSDGNGGTTGA
jgi:hypothetical protein